MEVEIIIKAWDRLEYTISALRRIWWTTRDVKPGIAVLDQGSVDGTREWLAYNQNGYYGPQRLITLEENAGEALGVLKAVENSPAKLIVTWNNDMYALTKDWLAKMLAHYKEQSTTRDHVYLTPTWVGVWNKRSCRPLTGSDTLCFQSHCGGVVMAAKDDFITSGQARPIRFEDNDEMIAAWGPADSRFRCRDVFVMHMNTSYGQIEKNMRYIENRYGPIQHMPDPPEKDCIDEEGGHYDWTRFMDDSEIGCYRGIPC